MSIKTRFGLLLGSLLAAFLVILGLIVSWERRDLAASVELARAEQRQMIDRWVARATQSLESVTGEAAASAEVRRFLASGDPGAAPAALEKLPVDFDFDAFWIYDAKGAIFFTRAVDLKDARPPGGEMRAAARHYFSEEGGILREIAVAPIAADPPAAGSAPLGWVVATRRWDPARQRALGNAIGSPVSIDAAATGPEGGLALPLIDSSGKVLRELHVTLPASAAIASAEGGMMHVYVFIGFSCLILAALGVALDRWILQPVARIDQSLRTGSPGPIEPLAGRPGEFGRVAELVRTAFSERRMLEREIVERRAAEAALLKSERALAATVAARARLARDLHDGIIQSLYAAGMGLTGVRAQLKPEQQLAAAQLEEMRAALNETIRDVRNFITGLEPEALRVQGFRQAIFSLVERMQGIQPLEAAIDIDDNVAARLTLDQRVHALLTAREALSNALRHGQASGVKLSLREDYESVEFTIADNGSGFDPSEKRSGFGLTSLAARAEEVGGTLAVDSAPGRGTTVRLKIPKQKSPP